MGELVWRDPQNRQASAKIIGAAKCSKEDVYGRETGIKIARKRAIDEYIRNSTDPKIAHTLSYYPLNSLIWHLISNFLFYNRDI